MLYAQKRAHCTTSYAQRKFICEINSNYSIQYVNGRRNLFVEYRKN